MFADETLPEVATPPPPSEQANGGVAELHALIDRAEAEAKRLLGYRAARVLRPLAELRAKL